MTDEDRRGGGQQEIDQHAVELRKKAQSRWRGRCDRQHRRARSRAVKQITWKASEIARSPSRRAWWILSTHRCYSTWCGREGSTNATDHPSLRDQSHPRSLWVSRTPQNQALKVIIEAWRPLRQRNRHISEQDP